MPRCTQVQRAACRAALRPEGNHAKVDDSPTCCLSWCALRPQRQPCQGARRPNELRVRATLMCTKHATLLPTRCCCTNHAADPTSAVTLGERRCASHYFPKRASWQPTGSCSVSFVAPQPPCWHGDDIFATNGPVGACNVSPAHAAHVADRQVDAVVHAPTAGKELQCAALLAAACDACRLATVMALPHPVRAQMRHCARHIGRDAAAVCQQLSSALTRHGPHWPPAHGQCTATTPAARDALGLTTFTAVPPPVAVRPALHRTPADKRRSAVWAAVLRALTQRGGCTQPPATVSGPRRSQRHAMPARCRP